VRITADVTNNSLLIYATEDNYRLIERTLRQIDRPQLQVAFDAHHREVTLNDSLTYGVQFSSRASGSARRRIAARSSTRSAARCSAAFARLQHSHRQRGGPAGDH